MFCIFRGLPGSRRVNWGPSRSLVDRIATEALGQDSSERLPVTVPVEQSHATVPPVQHMIDRAGFDRPGGSWHSRSLSPWCPSVNISDTPLPLPFVECPSFRT